ncbi:2-acylglycerol O-acyltransferase 1-like [Harmonia axyridis]|uniref:2-acylglycerol O-acyltransferase 1-like n=1 Tax=Harmonia axyridis TaxID=115357 RepID=UPI001E279A15|nr:2-acylglycerol O-acyltransferase 1-like [Harmonia axyridis]
MMKLFNIEWAPLQLPLKRRLQTLAIAAIIYVYAFFIFVMPSVLYYLIFYSKLWWLCIIYLVWSFFIDTDRSSDRTSKWYRNCSWFKYSRDYFPIKLNRIFVNELDSKRNYLFCCFPHGFLGFGPLLSLTTNTEGTRKYFPFHSIYTHTLTINFYIPIFRELAIMLGLVPTSKECLDQKMGKPGGGNISVLIVGGAEEAFHCNPGVHSIVLKNRKGFIKVALRNGCPLVPVYSFGENEVYGQYEFEEGSIIRKLQRKLKELTGVAFVLCKGRGFFQYSFGIVPYRRPINVVVGEPIDVQKTENPTKEQIDDLHQLFEKKLVELFESQKKYYLDNHETARLVIC